MAKIIIFRWLIGLNLLITVNYSLAQPQQIRPKIIRELSGYSIYDVGKSRYFFDTSGNTGGTPVDPLNGITTFPNPNGLHNGLPTKQFAQYYPDISQGYPGRRGNRVIFDLTGALQMDDTTHRVNLNSIYGYSLTFDTPGDTLYFYSLDTMFTQPVQNRWKFLARPDSLLTPIGILVTQGGGFGQWQHFTTTKTVRYLMIRDNLVNRGSYLTMPNYFKLVIYGNYNYDTTTVTKRPSKYTGPHPSIKKRTYGQFAGTNMGQGIDTLQLVYDGNLRIYGNVNYWDTSHTSTATKFRYDYFPDIGPTQYAAFKRQGRQFWWSNIGISPYLAAQGSTWRMNTDTYLADPENPFNYSREGQLAFYLGAKHGSITVSTSLTPLWDVNTGNGLNDWYAYENNNEPTGNGITMFAYWCQSVNDWDGYENRVGTSGQAGFKNADPNFPIIMGGMVLPDSNQVDNYIWFSQIMRTDKKPVFNIINWHQYSRTTDTLDHQPGLDELVGAHSQSAEFDSVYYKENAIIDATYNYLGGDTSYQIRKTEHGYGNWGTPAANTTQAGFPWDSGNTPSVGSQDSMSVKAMLLARSEMIMCFMPYYAYNEFFFHNSSFGSNNYLLYSSYGRATGRNNVTFACTTFFPFWYYRAQIYNALQNYYPDTLISRNFTNLWVTKWRKKGQTDSVCYVVWKGSYTGATLSNQTVNVGYVKGNTFNTVSPSYVSLTPSTGTASTSGQNLPIATVTEAPVFYFAKEIPNPGWWIFKHKAVFKSN